MCLSALRRYSAGTCTCMPDCFQTPVPVAISRQIAGKWHVSVEEIFANALLNGCALHPPRLFRANDLRLECDFSDGAFMPGETDAGTFFRPGDFEEGVKGYRLTTSTGKDGAVAIFYPGVMERLRGLMEGDYYVGFLGVDEVVIHPVLCKSPDEMKAAIHHVNGVYGEKDMLSDRVYRYWGARRRLLEVP